MGYCCSNNTHDNGTLDLTKRDMDDDSEHAKLSSHAPMQMQSQPASFIEPQPVQMQSHPASFIEPSGTIPQSFKESVHEQVNAIDYFTGGLSELAKEENNHEAVNDALKKITQFDWTIQEVEPSQQRQFRPMTKLPGGYQYEGEWVDDKKDGLGILKWPDGQRYDGVFVKNKSEGFGRFINTVGDVYEGQWHDDMQHGTGKMSWSDGSQYQGDFFEKNIKGKGVYKWIDGRIYEGDWEDNLMHGHGVFTWLDGKKYEGAYVQDVKCGHGKFNWPDGRIYEGEWAGGKQHGNGEYTHTNGKTKRGVWKQGKRQNWLKQEVGMALLLKIKETKTQNLKEALIKLLLDDKNIALSNDRFVPMDTIMEALKDHLPSKEQIYEIIKNDGQIFELQNDRVRAIQTQQPNTQPQQ